MLEPWKTGKVIKIEHVNTIIRRFWIEVLDTPTFNFKPGQFVTLDLPIHEQKIGVGVVILLLRHQIIPMFLN